MVDGLFGRENNTSRYQAATTVAEPLIVEIAISTSTQSIKFMLLNGIILPLDRPQHPALIILKSSTVSAMVQADLLILHIDCGAETEIYRVSNLTYSQNGDTVEELPVNEEFAVNVAYCDIANATGAKIVVAVYDVVGALIQTVQGNPADNFDFNVGSDKTISNIRVFIFTNMTTLVLAYIRYSCIRPAVTEQVTVLI